MERRNIPRPDPSFASSHIRDVMSARLRLGVATPLISIACALPLASQAVPPAPPPTGAATAVPNDNRAAVGRLVNSVLRLRLEAREANWYPEDAAGPAVPIFAFAETGRQAQVPGPMIRVPAGTELHLT